MFTLILVVHLYLSNHIEVSQVGNYDSKVACEDAGRELAGDFERRQVSVTFACVQR